MPDARTQGLARVLVDYSLSVQPGQLVVIAATPLAAPLVREVVRRVLVAGGHPLLQLQLPGMAEIMFRNASDDQLRYITPAERTFREQADATLYILSDTNTKELSAVNPERQRIAQQARTELFETFMRRSADGSLNWCITLYPTEAYAQDAEMSLADYEDFVYNAALVQHADPVAEWRARAQQQQRLIDWLAGKRELRVEAPGTELQLSIAGRTWENDDGRKNLPGGEIFTGPVENSVNGHVTFSFPSSVGGREVEGIQLWFEQGKVVKASAAKNEEYLHQMLETDEGARRLGEFAFGTNYAIGLFTGEILFDEKIGGTMHMAIGSGYPETGSQNKSAVHWDMICDLRKSSTVHVDGQLFMQDGQFTV